MRSGGRVGSRSPEAGTFPAPSHAQWATKNGEESLNKRQLISIAAHITYHVKDFLG